MVNVVNTQRGRARVNETADVMRRMPTLLMLLVIALMPFTALPAAADEEEIADLEAELEEAQSGLDEAMRRLSAARAELEQVEARLAAASAELGRAQAAANDAQERYDDAVREVGRTASALVLAEQLLVRAQARLEAALARETVAVARLEERVIKAFKDGSTHPSFGLAQGILNAGDWHDVARTAQMVQRAIDDDKAIVEEALAARREADEARESADRAKRDAQDLAILAEVAEERAAEELEELERLVAEREQAFAVVAAEQRRRQAIFDELEADAQVMQALAQELERRIALLRSGGTCAGQVPAGGSVFGEGNLPGWAQRLVSRVSAAREWARPVAVAASRHGVDAPVMAALVWSESGFRPTVVSHAGAIGLAQLMPGTAAGLGVDPWDPEQNLDGGARYLAMQIDRFGSLELGLAAYNAGPGRVVQYGGIPPFPETQIYVIRVIERCQSIAG